VVPPLAQREDRGTARMHARLGLAVRQPRRAVDRDAPVRRSSPRGRLERHFYRVVYSTVLYLSGTGPAKITIFR
jgi:hypothetical protein